MILLHIRHFLPALALLTWALGAALGVPPDALRIAGPLVTGCATAIHIHDEIRFHGDLSKRGR